LTAESGRVLDLKTPAALDEFLEVHAGAGPARDQQGRQAAAREAAQALRAMSQGVRLGGIRIKDLISEGRL
jgi:hypothetical protein